MVLRGIFSKGLAIAVCVAAAACSTAATAPAPRLAAARIKPSIDEPKLTEIVERSMPSVVLLLNTQADGSIKYGAGLLIEPGIALTSQHVVADAKTLGAMLYEPHRTSYTPMDGGLSRYLFENQSAIVEARMVAGDSTTDLALIEIQADTSRYPTLPIAREPVRPGDRVLALGHPQETVWSFTQGVVGAIQQGAIQHDAAISHGSSGGPLLNLSGEVVGINVAKILSEASGLAFARPISLAARYLGDRSVAALPLDMSTPAAAASSCWRAQEIGRLEVGDCFDWEAHWDMFMSIARDAMRIATPSTRERIRRELAGPGYKQRWIERKKREVAAYFVDQKPHEDDALPGPVPAELARARSEAEREKTRTLREHPELRGVFGDHTDPRELLLRLRLGIRVDRVAMVGPDRAWVQLAGRNPDGSIYRFSELYVKVDDRWAQRLPPLPADETTLPKSFAPLLATYLRYRVHRLEKLLRGPELPPPSDMACPLGPAIGERPTACTRARIRAI